MLWMTAVGAFILRHISVCNFALYMVKYMMNIICSDRGMTVDIQVKDEIVMKKPHPCGNNRFTVQRVGMDFKISCNGCGREVMVPRKQVERHIRAVYREGARVFPDGKV